MISLYEFLKPARGQPIMSRLIIFSPKSSFYSHFTTLGWKSRIFPNAVQSMAEQEKRVHDSWMFVFMPFIKLLIIFYW